ncbi:MAG TPA: M48 family metalloprotease, partial [Longimicrobium sp.]|nr:M48 family metalloprotease [Longimicrobium sp.]
MSNAKVFLLMAGLTGLFVALGGWMGGATGMVLATAFAAVMNVAMYFGSARLVLRMYGARVIERDEMPWLYDMTDALRLRADLPMPTLAIAPHAQPNAFATGRGPHHAVVCVTQGLLDLVSLDELEGVIAHELAHIKNRDML